MEILNLRIKLTSQDKLEEIPGKIITTSIQMLEETLKSIQTREYKRAVEAILKAENIVIYSVENSVCTANDLLTKLTYLGLNCRQYSDYYLQHVSAVNMTPKDLCHRHFLFRIFQEYSRNDAPGKKGRCKDACPYKF